MEAGKEVITRFPLDSLLFILIGGLFVVFSFPYTIPNVSSSFHPFANLASLIGVDFPIKATQMLLVSLIVGGIMYLNYGN
jgi:1,4-dihydroxy-2-naphthoate octaprenyltransferase